MINAAKYALYVKRILVTLDLMKDDDSGKIYRVLLTNPQHRKILNAMIL